MAMNISELFSNVDYKKSYYELLDEYNDISNKYNIKLMEIERLSNIISEMKLFKECVDLSSIDNKS